VAVSARVRYEVLRRDRYTCRFCGSSAPDVVLHIDHVEPKLAGGRDNPSNLQVLCEECNLGKSMTMPERWLVKETERRQCAFVRAGYSPAPPPPDDLTEMYAYIEAEEFLESQAAGDVIRAIMHVCADVFPYRPDGPGLICAAAIALRERLELAGAPD
jgi:hypothetical protein